MPENSDLKDTFKSVDLEAVGRHVAKVLVDWLSKPGLYQVLSSIHGPAEPEESSQTTSKNPCSQEGCNEPVRAKGLCAKHYQRQRYAKKREESPRTSGRGFGECFHEGCTRTVHARGMCGAHFMEWVRAKRKADEDQEQTSQSNEITE